MYREFSHDIIFKKINIIPKKTENSRNVGLQCKSFCDNHGECDETLIVCVEAGKYHGSVCSRSKLSLSVRPVNF